METWKIENLLYGYKQREAIIEIKKMELEEVEDVSLGSHSDNPTPGAMTARTNVSIVEITAEKREHKVNMIKNAIQKAERENRRIDIAVATLSQQEQEIIKYRYFEKMKVEAAAKKMGIVRNTFTKKKKEALEALKLIL